MHYVEFLDRIRHRGAAETRAKAERVAEATLGVLAETLAPDDVRLIAEHAPPELVDRLRPGEPFDLRDANAFYGRVRQREGTTMGRAVEHVQIVCRELASLLPAEARTRLVRHLAPSVAELFEPRAEPPEPPPPPLPKRREPKRSLATGRPASTHPIAESTADRSQDGSVARSSDPHGETKLSGARGTRQEQERRTLASGRPGSRHPLSGA